MGGFRFWNLIKIYVKPLCSTLGLRAAVIKSTGGACSLHNRLPQNCCDFRISGIASSIACVSKLFGIRLDPQHCYFLNSFLIQLQSNSLKIKYKENPFISRCHLIWKRIPKFRIFITQILTTDIRHF